MRVGGKQNSLFSLCIVYSICVCAYHAMYILDIGGATFVQMKIFELFPSSATVFTTR